MNLTYLWIGEAVACLTTLSTFVSISVYRMRGQSWTEPNEKLS